MSYIEDADHLLNMIDEIIIKHTGASRSTIEDSPERKKLRLALQDLCKHFDEDEQQQQKEIFYELQVDRFRPK